MRTMKAVEVREAGGPLQLVERQVPNPERTRPDQGAGLRRLHSDSLTKEGQWPGLAFPRVPGHEIAGVIDSVGAGVDDWQVGQASRRGLARRTLRTL